jgi:hypothetical protein
MWWRSCTLADEPFFKYGHFVGGAISGILLLTAVQLILLLKCYFRSRPARAVKVQYGSLEVRIHFK